MTIKVKIQEAIKTAMKAKDKIRLDTTRMVLAAIQYEEMQKKTDSISDEATVTILQREVNRRKEEIEYAEKAGRSDLLETLKAEIASIEEFMPKQLSSDEIEKIITDMKGANPSLNMGLLMKNLKDTYAGQYDGKVASEIAKKVLS